MPYIKGMSEWTSHALVVYKLFGSLLRYLFFEKRGPGSGSRDNTPGRQLIRFPCLDFSETTAAFGGLHSFRRSPQWNWKTCGKHDYVFALVNWKWTKRGFLAYVWSTMGIKSDSAPLPIMKMDRETEKCKHDHDKLVVRGRAKPVTTEP